MSLLFSAMYVPAPLCTHGCLVLDTRVLFSAWPPVTSPGSLLYPEVLTLMKNPLWPSTPPRNRVRVGHEG